MAKVLSYSNSNPKMGAPSTPVKGYKDGGEVVDTRPLVSKTSYRMPSGQMVDRQPIRGGTPVTSQVREGEGLVYDKYDTTLDAFAKAPTVGYGEAAKTTAMPDIAKPGQVTYYGEGQKAAAEKLTQERGAAYNRRLENAAISSGNAMPGADAVKSLYSAVPALTQKAVQYTLPKASEKAAMPKAASSSLTMDSLVKTATMLTPKSTLLYASDMIEYAKQRKKK
jgi:hypothetical protein